MKRTHTSLRSIGLLFTVLATSTVLFSACLGKTTTPPATTANSNPAADEKTGFTTLNGTIMLGGAQPLLKTANGTTSLESYDVDLQPFNGQKVSVTGKYSGDTLFVSSIEAAKP